MYASKFGTVLGKVERRSPEYANVDACRISFTVKSYRQRSLAVAGLVTMVTAVSAERIFWPVLGDDVALLVFLAGIR